VCAPTRVSVSVSVSVRVVGDRFVQGVMGCRTTGKLIPL